MKGRIKSFKFDRGFGFIQSGKQNKDYFFHISSFTSPHGCLNAGQEVEFSLDEDEKTGKLRAVNVSAIGADSSSASTDQKSSPDDPRTFCSSCETKVIPRINFYQGSAYKSHCPYCGGVLKRFAAAEFHHFLKITLLPGLGLFWLFVFILGMIKNA